MNYFNKHINDKVRSFFTKVSLKRMIFCVLLTIIVLGEVVSIITVPKDTYTLERTLFFMDGFTSHTGEAVVDVFDGQVDVKIDVQVITYYNFIRTVGLVQIDDAQFMVDEFRFLPITPLFEFGYNICDLVYFFAGGTMSAVVWTTCPRIHIESNDTRYNIHVDRDLSVDMFVYTEDGAACYFRHHINEHVQQGLIPRS